MFCMLLYLEAGRTEVHMPITFSFIPFCRQPLKQDKRFHSISGHVHRYLLFSSFFLPSDLIYFLNQKKLQTREACWYFEKEVNRVRRLLEAASSNLWWETWTTERTWLDGTSVFETVTPWHSCASQPCAFPLKSWYVFLLHLLHFSLKQTLPLIFLLSPQEQSTEP